MSVRILDRAALEARGYSRDTAYRILNDTGFSMPGGRKMYVRDDTLTKWERRREKAGRGKV